MAAKKKKKVRYTQVCGPVTMQQANIQKMRDDLNAPDPNLPNVFTRYKIITYIFVVLFFPYALYRLWCKKSEFNHTERMVQTAVIVAILVYFVVFRFFPS